MATRTCCSRSCRSTSRVRSRSPGTRCSVISIVRSVGGRLDENEIGHRVHQAVTPDHRQEVIRCEHDAVWLGPAQQRFETDQITGLQPELRLIDQCQLGALDSSPNVGQQPTAHPMSPTDRHNQATRCRPDDNRAAQTALAAANRGAAMKSTESIRPRTARGSQSPVSHMATATPAAAMKTVARPFRMAPPHRHSHE